MKKVIDIIKEMEAKGFTSRTAIDFSFSDGTVARCTIGDFLPTTAKEFPKKYADMNAELTSYYTLEEMLDMNMIAIEVTL